jgi:hypothetical protein
MSIQTLLDLQQAMADESAWRKKELHVIKSLVVTNEHTHNLDLYIRSGVTLLYAHWEGFVKEIGRLYLEFVGRRRLKHDQLSQGFLAMAIGRLLRSAGDGRIDSSLAVVQFFQGEMGSRSALPWRAGVDTKSNLNSEVFRDIVKSFGLDYSLFETKENLLDEKLLGNRNQIAHGKRALVDFDEYLTLHDEVFGMMQTFYNLVENSAITGTYRVVAPPYGAK